jgi:hypothetical protein
MSPGLTFDWEESLSVAVKTHGLLDAGEESGLDIISKSQISFHFFAYFNETF